jgi:hypothetical protein
MQYNSHITLTDTGVSYRGSVIKQVKSGGHSTEMFQEGHNTYSAIQELGKSSQGFRTYLTYTTCVLSVMCIRYKVVKTRFKSK